MGTILKKAWTRCLACVLIATVSFAVCPTFAQRADAQTHLEAVERLYSSASYEEALAALDTSDVAADADQLASEEYRILCLLGLGELERAEATIAKLVLRHPDYRPNPARFSPSRQEQFNVTRRQVLRRLFEAAAAEATASSEAKDYDAAVVRFEALLELLKVAGNDPQFVDLRAYAADSFRRAKAAALALVEAARPTPVAMNVVATNGDGGAHVVAATATAGRARVYDVSSIDVVPPVALRPILPPMSPEGSHVTPNPGLFEILVDESGRVQSASVRRSVSAQYDALVLNESGKWRFKPATLKGQPVPFRKLVEIYAVPLASLQR